MSDVHETDSSEFTTKSKRKQDSGLNCLLCNMNLQNLNFLKCLHYFCKLCLRSTFQLQLSVRDGKEPFLFSCPICHFPQNSENESASVDEILTEIYESQLLAAINDQENMLIGTSVCLPCKNRSKETISVSWCYECRSNLCENCLIFHDSMPTLASHKTFTNDEILDKIHLISYSREICEYHNIRLHVFCITHKTACCNTCIVDNHRSCHLVDLKTHANSEKNLTEQLRMSFSKLYCDLNDAMDTNVVEQELIEEFTLESTKHVNETYENWRRKLISLTDALTAETYKLFYHEIQICETKTTAQKSKAAILENCKEVLNSSLSSSDVRIFLEKIKVQTIYEDVLEFFNSQNWTIFSIRVQLTVDQTLRILSILDSFGRIQSRENPNPFPTIEASDDCKQSEDADATLASPSLSSSSSKKATPSLNILFNGKHLFCSISLSIAEGDSHVTGCDWVSGDRFIVVDVKTNRFGKSNARVYNLQGKMMTKINFHRACKPHDVVILDNGNAAITIPNMREIRIYNLHSGHMIKSHSTEINCYGICKITNDTLVVAGEKTILFINQNGDVIKSFSVNGQDIRYVCAVSNDLIFYSSLQDNRVYSVLNNGDEVYCFQTTKGAAGIITDSKRNVYFCEKGSNSVIKLDERGNFQTHIKVSDFPTAIAYSEKHGKICVVLGGRHRHSTAMIYS